MEFREILRTKGFHHDIVELEELVGLVKERVAFVRDLWDETDFFFSAPEYYDPEVIKKRWKPETRGLMNELKTILSETDPFTTENTEKTVKNWIESKEYNTGAVMNAFRLLVVGASRGPHIFNIISWIGKEETLKRIDLGLSKIA